MASYETVEGAAREVYMGVARDSVKGLLSAWQLQDEGHSYALATAELN
jgi:hypothetical protein